MTNLHSTLISNTVFEIRIQIYTEICQAIRRQNIAVKNMSLSFERNLKQTAI